MEVFKFFSIYYYFQIFNKTYLGNQLGQLGFGKEKRKVVKPEILTNNKEIEKIVSGGKFSLKK